MATVILRIWNIKFSKFWLLLAEKYLCVFQHCNHLRTWGFEGSVYYILKGRRWNSYSFWKWERMDETENVTKMFQADSSSTPAASSPAVADSRGVAYGQRLMGKGDTQLRASREAASPEHWAEELKAPTSSSLSGWTGIRPTSPRQCRLSNLIKKSLHRHLRVPYAALVLICFWCGVLLIYPRLVLNSCHGILFLLLLLPQHPMFMCHHTQPWLMKPGMNTVLWKL